MGTKPYYFLILVALTIGFVLIPTGKAESEIEIITISHDNARIENQIEILVINNNEQEIPYRLSIEISYLWSIFSNSSKLLDFLSSL